jgi:hypothetical protein
MQQTITMTIPYRFDSVGIPSRKIVDFRGNHMKYDSLTFRFAKKISTRIPKSKIYSTTSFLLAYVLPMLLNYLKTGNVYTYLVHAKLDEKIHQQRIEKDKFEDDDWDEYTVSPAPSASDQPSMMPTNDIEIGYNFTKVQMPVLRINVTAKDRLATQIRQQLNSSSSPNSVMNEWMESFLQSFFKESSRYRASFLEVVSHTVRWNDTYNTKSSTDKLYRNHDLFEITSFANFRGTIANRLGDMDKKDSKISDQKNMKKKNQKKKKSKNKSKKNRNNDDFAKEKDRLNNDYSPNNMENWAVQAKEKSSVSSNIITSTIPSETELTEIIIAYFSFWGTEDLLSYLVQQNKIGWDVTSVEVAINGNVTRPQVNSTTQSIYNTTDDDDIKNDIESATDDNNHHQKSLLQNPTAVLMIALGASILAFALAVFILLCQRRKKVSFLDDNDDTTSTNKQGTIDRHQNDRDGLMIEPNFNQAPMSGKRETISPNKNSYNSEADDDIMTLKSGSIAGGVSYVSRTRRVVNNCNNVIRDDNRDDVDSDNNSMTNSTATRNIVTTDDDEYCKRNRNDYLTTVSNYGFVSLLAGSLSPRTKLNTILDAEESSTDHDISSHSRCSAKIGLPHRELSGHSRCVLIPEDDSNCNNSVSLSEESHKTQQIQDQSGNDILAIEEDKKQTKQPQLTKISSSVSKKPLYCQRHDRRSQNSAIVLADIQSHTENANGIGSITTTLPIIQANEVMSYGATVKQRHERRRTNLASILHMSSLSSSAPSLSLSKKTFSMKSNVDKNATPPIASTDTTAAVDETSLSYVPSPTSILHTDVSLHSAGGMSSSICSKISFGYTSNSDADIVSLADDFSIKT